MSMVLSSCWCLVHSAALSAMAMPAITRPGLATSGSDEGKAPEIEDTASYHLTVLSGSGPVARNSGEIHLTLGKRMSRSKAIESIDPR